MRVVRRHLRRGVAAWLVSHALTFTALVPRDCCDAHAHAGERAAVPAATDDGGPPTPPCHEPPSEPTSHCDMAAGDGASCPMHDGASATRAVSDCMMTGACGAPAAMLHAVLLQPAVMTAPVLFLPHVFESGVDVLRDASVRSLVSPPDAPPPRL